MVEYTDFLQGKDHKYRMAVAYCYYLASVELIELIKLLQHHRKMKSH